jgi:hypothetical protein
VDRIVNTTSSVTVPVDRSVNTTSSITVSGGSAEPIRNVAVTVTHNCAVIWRHSERRNVHSTWKK